MAYQGSISDAKGDCDKAILYILPLYSMLWHPSKDHFWATNNGFIQKVGDMPAGAQFTCLQYADDIIILAPTYERSLVNIKCLLICFEMTSGLMINFSKSAIFRLGNTSPEDMDKASTILCCLDGQYLMTYMGLPIRSTVLNREDWIPLIDRVEKRLDSWKGNCLSCGGRLVLVNSVLSAMPIHYMSFYILPKWVIQRADRIRRSFFWKGERAAACCFSLIRWSTLCSPKPQGDWASLVCTYSTKPL